MSVFLARNQGERSAGVPTYVLAGLLVLVFFLAGLLSASFRRISPIYLTDLNRRRRCHRLRERQTAAPEFHQ